MGRPYETELAQLAATYQWALRANIDRLVATIGRATSWPLVAVGSGGSLSVAEFATSLHRNLARRPASAQTPLDAVADRVNLRRGAVLMTSAGGTNPDVLGSFDVLARREPANFTVVCLSANTPLARRAGGFPFVDFVELEPPVPRDGFLATNSLLALVVVLTRAYAEACGANIDLPREWRRLMAVRRTAKGERTLDHAWTRETLVVLHGPSTRVAAVDLESRFTEAALQDVWISDYRNFAHGRHHWLAKRPRNTAVLAFVTPEDRALATKTLALIPKEVLTIREDIPFSGVPAAISALGRVIHLAGSAGYARGIDPGRPGVPTFGRRIYHLNAFTRVATPAPEEVAIERKTGIEHSMLSALGLLNHWRAAYQAFVKTLRTTRFRGLVVDYDGTLCGDADRYGALQPEVASELERLARGGIILGIATGRGKSVRTALRAAVSQEYWSKIVVGYYNGGDIRLLSDDNPDGTSTTAEILAPVAEALTTNRLLMDLVTVELRPPQIKIEPKRRDQAEFIWALVEHTIHSLRVPGTSVLRSSHSIDILAAGVDKRAVVTRVAQVAGASEEAILCIGDRGRYPGNDYLLLNARCALSVDETSPDPATCWNLAPVGWRQVPACLAYLRDLKVTRGAVRFGGAARRTRRA